jgi:hypothetical protein
MFSIGEFVEEMLITRAGKGSNNSSIYYQNRSFKDEDHH